MKYDKETLIKEFKKIHNNKYDYSLFEYHGYKKKSIIICPIHGKFEQTVQRHLEGRNCKKCAIELSKHKISKSNTKRKRTFDDIVKLANQKHNSKYQYVKIDGKKLVIICPHHGEFKQFIHNHLKGCGCKLCAIDNRRMTTEDFIKKSKEIYGERYDYSKTIYKSWNKKITILEDDKEIQVLPYDHFRAKPNKSIKQKRYKDSFIQKAIKKHNNKYDYSKVEYIKHNVEVCIICPHHGEFYQKPSIHLNSHGCQKCAREKSLSKLLMSKSEYIKRISDNNTDTSLVEYNGYYNKVKLRCIKHDTVYEVTPNNSLSGVGCPECYKESRRLPLNEFIKRCKEKHENKYNYSHVRYNCLDDVIYLKCVDHGKFSVTAINHMRGSGCPKCGLTIPQREIIRFLETINNIELKINDRSIINPLELDILINNKLAVELNGIYWHSYNQKESSKQKYKHYNKFELANENNIELLQFTDMEWKNKQNIVKSIISSKLNINNRIFARKCEITNLSSEQFNKFFDDNHMQGRLNTSIRIGLEHNGRIVCAMGFNKHTSYDYYITRYANILNCNVIGGASKIFKNFITRYKPSSILTFADRRYSKGLLYKKIGFSVVSVTKPNYCYIKNNKIYSRMSFQKHKLNKLESFDPSLSESQNMFNNGYRRIWDAGNYKMVWYA